MRIWDHVKRPPWEGAWPEHRAELQLGTEATPSSLELWLQALLSHPVISCQRLSLVDPAGNQRARLSRGSNPWKSASWSKGQEREWIWGDKGNPLASRLLLLFKNHQTSMTEGTWWPKQQNHRDTWGSQVTAAQSRISGQGTMWHNSPASSYEIHLTVLKTEVRPSLRFKQQFRIGVPCTLISTWFFFCSKAIEALGEIAE